MAELGKASSRYAMEKRPVAFLHETEILSIRGKCMVSFIERWGMVQGVPDGEDSAGRARMGLMEPVELIERAAQITESLFSELESRGWVHAGPTLAELDAAFAETELVER